MYLVGCELLYLVDVKLLMMIWYVAWYQYGVSDSNIKAQTLQCNRRCLAMMFMPHKLIKLAYHILMYPFIYSYMILYSVCAFL